MSDVVNRHPGTMYRISAFAGIVAVAVVLFQTLTVDASRPVRVIADPTPVALVNVARIFDQIGERSEWDIRIEALKSSIRETATSRQATMQRRLAESEQATSPEERQKIRDEVALMQIRFEEWARVKNAEVDREESLKWRSIYRNLQREAARVAENEGYAMVMVDDTVGDITTTPGTQVPLQQQVLEQITNRRLLYATKTVDISDQVIVRMNNAANAAP
ncbi:MAG: hypothetical protein CMJ34_04375 [Phycisphaerae bacterium]|nr:hypothetical protein [Phycisphaerae bacterium]